MPRCAYCYNRKIGRSRRRGWEWLLVPLLLRPYRCKHCNKRFIWFVGYG